MYWAWIEIDRTVANACAHTFLPTVAHLSICMGRERESVCACLGEREREGESNISCSIAAEREAKTWIGPPVQQA